MSKKGYFFVFFFTAINLYAQPPQFESVRQLAQRRVAWLEPKLEFRLIPTDGEKEVFELSTNKQKVQISASSENSAAMGLNWYLKYFCHRSMSHMGDNLSPVPVLPQVKNKVRISAVFPLRYALNYCTINYTMAFYTWKDWERELDWMALNGVNLMLAPIGTEAVWQNTLKRLGCSEKEILAFIPGPGFTAWWLMGNLQGWGGPITQSLIDQQKILETKILKRMREFGIQPILQGFYGMVPTSLKQKIKIQVKDQGKWAGGFTRPDFLIPSDTNFERVAAIYYEEMQKLYGKDIHYFGGEPFHEGGNSKGINIAESAKEIQRIMQRFYPASTWVLQGWQSNPSKALLSGLDKSKTLVIELFGENSNNWEKRNAYDSTPFIWSNVSNFGEKTGLYGKLQRFANEVYRAKNSGYGTYLKGIGIIPEGIRNNPVAYDLMLELGWHSDSVDVNQWITHYVDYRYGKGSKPIYKAWQLLLQTVYSSPVAQQEGPSESIFCARPGIDIKTVSSWGTRKRNYDPKKLEEAANFFVLASKQYPKNETYEVDKTDILRQVNANKADTIYAQMMEAIKSQNQKLFAESSSSFCKLLLTQDSLLGRNKFFSLTTWLDAAKKFGKNATDKSIALWNARTQISYWGGIDSTTNLHDYAHKEWGGLLSTLYLERWKKFIADIKNGQVEPEEGAYYEMEKKWADGF